MEPRKAELEGVLEVPTFVLQWEKGQRQPELPYGTQLPPGRVSVRVMLGKVRVCSQTLSCVHVAPAAAFRLV